MRTSLNPLMYKIQSYSKLIEEAGTYELLLSPGTYYVALCGGGGAGGGKGTVTDTTYASGNGGRGETATPISQTIVLEQSVRAIVHVGAGGLTKANGGNGGAAGASTDAGTAGGGGGGGEPTYIEFETPIDGNITFIHSAGGGGGGGGGGAGRTARYPDGGSGGGGGGYYRFENGNIVSVPGKNGGKGGVAIS